MSEYQLEIKQIVDYPRCRIYRQFIQMLLAEKNIRIGGTSGLFYYTVLCCYANFRTSYKRIDGISYTIRPGEWLCRISEVSEWFRTRFHHQAVDILKELQERHLITYTILGRGKLVKFKINGWSRHNRVLDYNAPCQKESGFFFLPISTANELAGCGKCSEMDALLDMWINTVYNDTQVQGSETGPVVYMRDGSGSPLIGYAELAERWGISKATVARFLKKLRELDFIETLSFPGTHGTAIYLRRYLSTMFEISDVMIDKDEVAMALNIKLDLPEKEENECELPPEVSVSKYLSGVSKSHISVVLQKVAKILAAQGFPCCSCPQIQYKLLPLSPDCQEAILVPTDITKDGELRFLLVMSCNDAKEVFRFEIRLQKGERQ
ncbi:MAG: MarR family transcriptional regulator [Oscillospiraceae bacterium]|nr:MarR family transcriptional regulator [Oscillospiraceae bacterium]